MKLCQYAACVSSGTARVDGYHFCKKHAREHERDPGATPAVQPKPIGQLPAALTRSPGGNRQAQTITEVPVRVLAEHPANIRSDLGDISELAGSIKAQGILQPLLITHGGDGRYLVVAGHRRLAAALQLKLERVPVRVRAGISTLGAVELMLVENLHRADLHPLDEARAYKQLEDAGYTHLRIGNAVGKYSGHIGKRLALLLLTAEEQEALRRGEISVDAAYLIGRERNPRRRRTTPRPQPHSVPHFRRDHPLADEVAARCLAAEHEVVLKLGPACGPCWERAIRDDALAAFDRQEDCV
jgi:ParB family chromosome partitioning protein